MPATGTDLLATSGGELDLGLFPGDTLATLTTKLNTWVAAGLVLYPTSDASAREYGYVKAYSAAIALRASEAASQTLKTGESISYTGEQLLALERLLARHEAELDALVPGTSDGTSTLTGSRFVRHVVEW